MADEESKAPDPSDPQGGASESLEGGAKSTTDPAEDEAALAEAEAAAKAKAEAAAKAKAEKEAIEAAKPAWEKDPSTPEWTDADEDDLVQMLRREHPDAIISARFYAGDLVLDIQREEIRVVCESLKTGHSYLLLVDICGGDHPDRESGRFDVIYHAYNLETDRRVRLRVVTDEATPVPSVCPVWKGANWPEREVYDMYGVRFSDHPDMTRILLWEGFNGFPLRKDFPVEGIDTGSAIYPEFYDDEAGPVAGTGTGWKPPEPPAPAEPETPAESSVAGEGEESADL
jgi:NADH-quinone oxidoreductase subunit C